MNLSKVNIEKSLLSSFAFAIVTAFAFTGCAEQKSSGLTTEDYQEILHERDSVINNWMGSFSDIETALAELKEREDLIVMAGSEELNKRGKDAILEDINVINELLDENKMRIAELEKSLEKSGIKISAFRKQVDRLTADLIKRQEDIVTLEEALLWKEDQIRGLTYFVDTLNTQLAVQEEALIETESKLVETSDQLNTTIDNMHTAYVATGKSRDLIAQGLLRTRFLGATTLKADLPLEAFTSVDIRDIKAIPLGSDKAELMTFHPEGSYALVENGETKNTTLEITHPDEFWEVSKYLVVSLK